jgi:hypothetical protein
MAYAPQLWIDIKLRYWKKESPEEISASLGGKPTARAIWKKVREDNWNEKKFREVQKKEVEISEDFGNYLESQNRRYQRILSLFDATYQNKNKLGYYVPYCSVMVVISIHKEQRELMGIIIGASKKQESSQKVPSSVLLKNPDCVKKLQELEHLQGQLDALEEELGNN